MVSQHVPCCNGGDSSGSLFPSRSACHGEEHVTARQVLNATCLKGRGRSPVPVMDAAIMRAASINMTVMLFLTAGCRSSMFWLRQMALTSAIMDEKIYTHGTVALAAEGRCPTGGQPYPSSSLRLRRPPVLKSLPEWRTLYEGTALRLPVFL